ncbi:MAG: transcription antitermination factor NusB [Pseudomonadota bacterium]
MNTPDLAPGIATRLAAAKILHSVFKTRRSLDDCFSTNGEYSGLPPVDQGFARAMVIEALRQGGRLDHGIGEFLDRPVTGIDPDVRALLWLGVTQLWSLGTPAHAAVGETVAAAKSWPQTRKASGLVNAVLRKATLSRETFDATPAEKTWPDWVHDEFLRSLGLDGARALAAAQIDQPQLHLTSLEPDVTAQTLDGAVIAPGSVAITSARVDTLPGFQEGRWWVQDAAAALAARILAPGEDECVLDLCAAPGGKTLQLAATGARVIALDRSKNRLERVRENLDRTGLADRVDVIHGDVETWTPPVLADAILLDAPCSALGTLRRHPEGAWIKSEREIQGYRAVQARFLDAAAAMLKPGGRLVYCVCTPRREEGLEVIESALGDEGLVRDPIRPPECNGFEGSVTAAGDVLTIPNGDKRHDAFFISRLRRRLK